MRARPCLFVVLVLAALSCVARGFGVDSTTERGLRLLASARAHDLGSEAPAWTLAMAPLGTRTGLLFELLALIVLFRATRALRVSPVVSAVALSAIAVDPILSAGMVSGEPVAAALLGFSLLLATHVCRAGVFGRIGSSPWLTAAMGVLAMLLSFDLVFVALIVVIARHPTRRIALVAFASAFLVVRLALGALVPAPLTSEAAFLSRLPAIWGSAGPGRFVPALRETWDLLGKTATLVPIAIGAGFVLFSVASRGRACARSVRMIAPILGAVIALVVFAPFVSPSATRLAPLIAALMILVAIGVDGSRGRLAPVFLFVLVVACVAVTEAPPRIAHRTLSGDGPIVCAPCGTAWLTRRDLFPLASLDADGRDAIRDGSLLAYARTHGVVAFALEPRLLTESLLGARFREELFFVGGMHRIAKIGDAELTLGPNPTPPSQNAGDGFLLGPRGAESRGARAELVFVAPAKLAGAKLQILMRSALTEAQRVELSLDGTRVGRVTVTETARWFEIPLAAARPGRSRVRLTFLNARTLPGQGSDAWRSPDGRAIVSVIVESLRLFTGEEPRLPPEGPGLDDPRFDRVLRSGFLGVERDAKPAAVWATGTAEIAFHFTPGKNRTLEIEAGPPPGGDQTMTVRLDGTRLGELNFPADTISVRSLDIPDGTLVDGENVLTLSFRRIAVGRAAYIRSIALKVRP
ncbi:MAG: hypothetical protein ACXVEF_10220 [Polyangiales bacterium]